MNEGLDELERRRFFDEVSYASARTSRRCPNDVEWPGSAWRRYRPVFDIERTLRFLLGL